MTQSLSDDVPAELHRTADSLLILFIPFIHVLQFYKSSPGTFLSMIMAVLSVLLKSSSHFAYPFSAKWQIYNILNATDCQSHLLCIKTAQKGREYSTATYMQAFSESEYNYGASTQKKLTVM